MTFERLLGLVRDQRRRIADLQELPAKTDDDIAAVMVEQTLYDSRLIELARMLDVPPPRTRPDDGGLYADHRAMIEDRLAEAGADVRDG
jgi:hypothetical protein